MVTDKKPRLRKFDRSARTGELYGPRQRPEDITPDHDKEVTAKVKRLREENTGKDMVFFEVRCPRPDIIQVDYEKKEIIAWELSREDQFSEKMRKYKNHDIWADHVIIVQTKEGKERTRRYLWRRIRLSKR